MATKSRLSAAKNAIHRVRTPRIDDEIGKRLLSHEVGERLTVKASTASSLETHIERFGRLEDWKIGKSRYLEEEKE